MLNSICLIALSVLLATTVIHSDEAPLASQPTIRQSPLSTTLSPEEEIEVFERCIALAENKHKQCKSIALDDEPSCPLKAWKEIQQGTRLPESQMALKLQMQKFCVCLATYLRCLADKLCTACASHHRLVDRLIYPWAKKKFYKLYPVAEVACGRGLVYQPLCSKPSYLWHILGACAIIVLAIGGYWFWWRPREKLAILKAGSSLSAPGTLARAQSKTTLTDPSLVSSIESEEQSSSNLAQAPISQLILLSKLKPPSFSPGSRIGSSPIRLVSRSNIDDSLQPQSPQSVAMFTAQKSPVTKVRPTSAGKSKTKPNKKKR